MTHGILRQRQLDMVTDTFRAQVGERESRMEAG
jgi:hypothetical protein